MSEKTEEPTAKKLRDAREQGNLMSSREVVSTAVVVAGVMGLSMIGPDVPKAFRIAMIEAVQLANRPDFSIAADNFLRVALTQILSVSGVVFVAIVIAGILSNVLQIGIYFSVAKLGQGMESLNPISNATNLFSKKTLVQFAVNLVKTLIILAVAWHVISGEKNLVEKIYSCRLDIFCGLRLASSTVFNLILFTVLAMVPVAVIDWVIQRIIYINGLKMSIDEVHREYKESEGSPEMKGHRRQMAHEIVNDSSAKRAKNASVVVRNPTHVAVALRYAPDFVALPYVICKGMGAQAERIIMEAEREGIPTYEDIGLARGLNDACDVNDFVPSDLVEPVAKLVRWLYVNYPQRVYPGPEDNV
jgi:type III secretion protein U